MMQARRGQSSMSSVAAQLPGQDAPDNYAASKAAIEIHARLAVELAPAASLVNAVSPRRHCHRHWRLSASGAEGRREALSKILLSRSGQPERVASVIAFLAGPPLPYITAPSCPFDGGRCRR